MLRRRQDHLRDLPGLQQEVTRYRLHTGQRFEPLAVFRFCRSYNFPPDFQP